MYELILLWDEYNFYDVQILKHLFFELRVFRNF